MQETHLALCQVEGQEALGQKVVLGLSPGEAGLLSIVRHVAKVQM